MPLSCLDVTSILSFVNNIIFFNLNIMYFYIYVIFFVALEKLYWALQNIMKLARLSLKTYIWSLLLPELIVLAPKVFDRSVWG
jgi:hypothetical protein